MFKKIKEKQLSNKVQISLFITFTILLFTYSQLNPISIKIDIQQQTKLLFVEPEQEYLVEFEKRDITELQTDPVIVIPEVITN